MKTDITIADVARAACLLSVIPLVILFDVVYKWPILGVIVGGIVAALGVAAIAAMAATIVKVLLSGYRFFSQHR